MATPPWWEELVGVSEVLSGADCAEVEGWRGPAANIVEEDEDDVPPLTVRLGTLGRVFGEQSAEFTPEQSRRVLRLLELIQAEGSDEDGTAVATGFFEALLNAWDKGFDLRSIWADVGPKSRAHCRAWNDFTGVETPGWMR
ncbi:hypothetical protein [Streptomyces olivoreticuli]|uniref:hypothetical protein n=1 Tax=Streptomyces olivoreticuli TaxID=68246 RepID=UPI000E223CC4|nr:hypothetical protein [Streptomyces olivoreticuli]